MKTCYYLNNTGSRWVYYYEDNRKELGTWQTKKGRVITRRIKFWEAFGNFATAAISYKGKLIKVFPDTILDD